MPHTELQVRSHRRGFTLIELMIVVAIIAILAMVAYPSYVEYVRRGHRAEAQTALLGAAQFMQRFYAANNRYDQDLSTNPVQLPSGISIPGYNLTVSATQAGFTLTATPTGVMSGDRCGNLTINQLGVRAVTGSGATVANCWK